MMNKVFSIAKKELTAYFKSPIAYIVLILTISVFNIFFYMIVDQNREASLRDVFKVMEFMFIFLVPLLTMKVLSEEKLTGTMEFLMTSPLTNTAIVLGKYLGSLIFFTLIICMTVTYYFIIEYFGQPDRMSILTGFFGIWLEGSFFLAIGILTSSWTRNQIIAAISSYAILFSLYFSISFTNSLSGPMEAVVRYAGTWSHLGNFTVGLITIADVVYYLSGIILCLILTRFGIENRLWR
jgi:ABC-2 type transport system permease protein